MRAPEIELDAALCIPSHARGIVLLADAISRARDGPRSIFIARQLQEAGFATLQLDLLSAEEEARSLRAPGSCDVRLLAERWIAATDWIGAQRETSALAIGYLGSSTGAGAALLAAAQRAPAIAAVVARGGRPDLAGAALGRVRAPTLLIVGGDDVAVLEHNRKALARLRAPDRRLFVIPGARHRFEEPGALETVARLAADWFGRHLDGSALRAAR